MTSRELIRWSARHERRARGGWWTSPAVVAIVAGGALAAFVAWRADAAGPIAASHAWLAGALAATALAFMRVPFQLYWRADAALLAQLPIEGRALFDAALARCIRSAVSTTVVAMIGAAPLAITSLARPDTMPDVIRMVQPPITALALFAHHAVFAIAFGVAAAFLLPAVATWAASLVAFGQHARGQQVMRVATVVAGGANPIRLAQAAAPQPPPSSGAVLGALPGFASAVVIVLVILVAPWLYGGDPTLPAGIVLAALVAASVLAIVGVRATAPRIMGTILRDVSALDRQRLATLEIRPPTQIERAIASLLGDASLPYRKDARLVRRRYPMAFALGALAFLVLAIVGLSRPKDPAPFSIAVLAGAAMYGVALAGRLYRAPIELPRLAATLPITARARARAKLAWLAGWWLVFVGSAATFAIARNHDGSGLVLLGVATVGLTLCNVGRW